MVLLKNGNQREPMANPTPSRTKAKSKTAANPHETRGVPPQELSRWDIESFIMGSKFFALLDMRDQVSQPGPNLEDDETLSRWAARVQEATGLNTMESGVESIETVAKALQVTEWGQLTAQERVNALNIAARRIQDCKPQDAVEAALVRQALILEANANRYLRLSGDQVMMCHAEFYLNAANKLFVRYQAIMDALIRYRRGGQQKVVVEHVHVEAGGRAIVGNVEHRGGGDE